MADRTELVRTFDEPQTVVEVVTLIVLACIVIAVGIVTAGRR